VRNGKSCIFAAANRKIQRSENRDKFCEIVQPP
jgi:hypothetical protein